MEMFNEKQPSAQLTSPKAWQENAKIRAEILLREGKVAHYFANI